MALYVGRSHTGPANVNTNQYVRMKITTSRATATTAPGAAPRVRGIATSSIADIISVPSANMETPKT
ncbi:MAG TPA: hypothetical protein VL173_09370 [Vicinamibacterales bacterium]|nr:hypothetical protein [Vicinamibacterales bacterium]